MSASTGQSARQFPPGFLWGAATAPHQVEGGNVNSDNWVLEHLPGTRYEVPSGDACDFYHRYPHDIATVAALGLSALRFGVEWARVEPEPGLTSPAALDHYSRVVDACLAHGITPVVTLHHFTSPRWLITSGGWRADAAAERFGDYAATVMRRLGDRVAWVCTINEANLPLQLTVTRRSDSLGRERSAAAGAAAADAFGVSRDALGLFVTASDEAAIAEIAAAHERAVDAVHAARADAKVGVTLSIQPPVAESGGEKRAEDFDEQVNRRFLRELGTVGDFVGVQNYTTIRFGPDGPERPTGDVSVSDIGHELVPASLATACRHAHELTGLPVLVSEHGADLGDDRDELRGRYIEASLGHVADAIAEGVDVRGYLHWSLLDSFEWLRGYRSRFGLLGVDHATQRRWIRPSATVLGTIARANQV
jgi:beta-glucosidase